MNVAVAKTGSSQPLGEAFAVARDRLPGTGTVADVRKAAFDDFTERGLPHRRIEEWKYTDLRMLLRDVAPLAPAPDQAALGRAATAAKSLGIEGAQTFVLVDGMFVPQLSDVSGLENGVSLRTLRDVLEDKSNAARADLLQTSVASDAMISLNAALATDGMVIDVADGASLNKPLHIVHVATHSDTSVVTRSLVRIGNDARVTLIESFVAADGAKAYQSHDSIVIWIGDRTEVQHVRLMEDALDAANITTAIFTLGTKTKLNTFNLTHGAKVSRYQGFIRFGGQGAELTTNGVNLLGGQRHGDTTLLVDHAVPGCMSREVFRSVLDGRGHSVFQGRIIVRPDAQQTDGKMMTRALLLSDEAEIDNKPELEIFADDVSCGHGATAGALDESLLFYLRARGLPEKEAQALLVEAFVGEAIESIQNDDLRDIAIAAAQRWLAARE